MPTAVRALTQYDDTNSIEMSSTKNVEDKIMRVLDANEAQLRADARSPALDLQNQIAARYQEYLEPDIGRKLPFTLVLLGTLVFCGGFWALMANFIFG